MCIRDSYNIVSLWNGGCAGFFYGYGIPDCTISAEKDFDDGVKKIVR